jgi:hypothetical protein
MKYETYKNQLATLKVDIISDVVKGCLSNGILEFELHNPLIYQYVDDQTNEVIGRINIEQQVAVIDDSFNMYNVKLDKLSLDILIELLCEFEQGRYKVWEVIDN